MGEPSGDYDDESASGRELGDLIALDQVTELLTTSSSGRVFNTDAALALAEALLLYYAPQEVANTLLSLCDAHIIYIRDGLLTGAVSIRSDHAHAPFVFAQPSLRRGLSSSRGARAHIELESVGAFGEAHA